MQFESVEHIGFFKRVATLSDAVVNARLLSTFASYYAYTYYSYRYL